MAPARPNLASGVRAAIATTLPLLLLPLLGRPELTWASLAGFNTIMVDKGGAYRSRAASMTGYSLAGSFAFAAGTLASTHPVGAVALVLVAITGFGMLRPFGAAATSVGISAAVALVIALSLPTPSPHAALARAGFGLLGSAWALGFSLVLWPIRPYRPVRLAVAATFRDLATLCEALASMEVPLEGRDSWQLRANDLTSKARLSVETARAALATLRRGRPGSSLRGEQLVVLLEGGDQLLGDLAALKTALAPGPTCAAERDDLLRMGAGLLLLAKSIEEEREPPTGLEGFAPGSLDGVRGVHRACEQFAELARTARALDGTGSPAQAAEVRAPELLMRGSRR